MEKLPTFPEMNIPLEEEVIEDYGHSYNTTIGYPKNPKYIKKSIPVSFIHQINLIILKQNEIIDKLEKILQSNLGKAILGLEPFPKQEEKKV